MLNDGMFRFQTIDYPPGSSTHSVDEQRFMRGVLSMCRVQLHVSSSRGRDSQRRRVGRRSSVQMLSNVLARIPDTPRSMASGAMGG